MSDEIEKAGMTQYRWAVAHFTQGESDTVTEVLASSAFDAVATVLASRPQGKVWMCFYADRAGDALEVLRAAALNKLKGKVEREELDPMLRAMLVEKGRPAPDPLAQAVQGYTRLLDDLARRVTAVEESRTRDYMMMSSTNAAINDRLDKLSKRIEEVNEARGGDWRVQSHRMAACEARLQEVRDALSGFRQMTPEEIAGNAQSTRAPEDAGTDAVIGTARLGDPDQDDEPPHPWRGLQWSESELEQIRKAGPGPLKINRIDPSSPGGGTPLPGGICGDADIGKALEAMQGPIVMGVDLAAPGGDKTFWSDGAGNMVLLPEGPEERP